MTNDWRELARLAATALHETTGRPISAMCTALYQKWIREFCEQHSRLHPFEQEVSDFVYAELDTWRLRQAGSSQSLKE